jgi:hypothetical protein
MGGVIDFSLFHFLSSSLLLLSHLIPPHPMQQLAQQQLTRLQNHLFQLTPKQLAIGGAVAATAVLLGALAVKRLTHFSSRAIKYDDADVVRNMLIYSQSNSQRERKTISGRSRPFISQIFY